MNEKTTPSAIAKSVMTKEARAIEDYAQKADPALADAIELIYAKSGPVIVAGVGKSGHIARKIASTMRSLGKPSSFLHASEASHGDLGIIHQNSAVIVLSNSGETTELSDLLHYCRNHKISVIALTSNSESTLARLSDVVICYGRTNEACINGLAPTTSTTLCLAIGDALAVGVSHKMNIAPEDFRRYHPGGKLGARLVSVSDLMKTGEDIPKVRPEASITEALITMSEKSLGSVLVMDEDRVLGIVTDGDMRRNIQNLDKSSILDISTSNPIYVPGELLACDAVAEMGRHGITACLVGEPGKPIQGFLHIHDCISAGQSK